MREGRGMQQSQQVMAGSVAPRIGDGNSPWNEWFSMTPQQHALLKRLHPELFDTARNARERAQKWRAFAQTSAGKALRLR